jgi:hypothetical protein
MEKSFWAIFSTVGLAQCRRRPISAHESVCQPITTPPSLTDGARLQLPSSPKSTPAAMPRVVTGEFPVTEPSMHRFLLTLVPPPVHQHLEAIASPLV